MDEIVENLAHFQTSLVAYIKSPSFLNFFLSSRTRKLNQLNSSIGFQFSTLGMDNMVRIEKDVLKEGTNEEEDSIQEARSIWIKLFGQVCFLLESLLTDSRIMLLQWTNSVSV